MIDSETLIYKPYQDARIKKEGFVTGRSGELLAGESENGKKYIVKHTYPHNVANEFVGCWLAEKLGLPSPKAYLLTPNRRFKCGYAVAIEFLEDLKKFSLEETTQQQKMEVLGHMAMTHLIRNEDIVQMNMYRGHVVSYDFADAFEMEEMKSVLDTLKRSQDWGVDRISRIFARYRKNLTYFDYDLPEMSTQLGLDRKEAHKIMVETAKRVLAITDDEITEMGEELEKVYPLPIAIYYEECVHAMQKHVEVI